MKKLNIAQLLNLPALASYVKLVDQNLLDAVTLNDSPMSQPLTRLLSARSKRLRPSLVIAVVASRGMKIDKRVIAACTAIELVHLGSLVHDDIIDQAKTRWDLPTISSHEGINQAIIIGDYLLANAGLEASRVSSRAAQLVSSTIAKLCQGQSQELADTFNTHRSLDSYLEVSRQKTAVLFAAACEIGGHCLGLGSVEIANLSHFGEAFGMTYQLIDDLLDLVSTSGLLGKPVGSDIGEGVYTMPIILALIGSNSMKTRAWLSKKISNRPALINSLLQDGSIKQTITRIKAYNQAASMVVKSFDNTSSTKELRNLADNYTKQTLSHLVDVRYRSTISKMLLT